MLGVVGIAAVAAGLVRQPSTLRTGANEFVNDRSRPEAHNSPTVAVDPRQPTALALANRLDAPGLGCAVSTSANAGATWEPLPLPPGLAAENCYWPRVAFLPDGSLAVLYTTLAGPNLLPVSVWLQRFENRQPVGEPQQVAGDLAFHARMAVSGARMWLTWVQAGPATAENQLGIVPGDNPIIVARSDDGGRTFGPPARVSEPERRVIQPTVLAGAEGMLVIGALDLTDDLPNYEASHDGATPPGPDRRWRIVTWTSTDGGGTFGPASVVAGDLEVPQLIIADLGPTPGFALDPARGRIYAAWDSGRGDARNCHVSFSDDGGRTWSRAVTVGPTAGEQLLPAVAVSPEGRVDVAFYDRSRDRAGHLQEVVVASSQDGGRTFRWTVVSDAAFDSRIGLGAQQGVPLQGDHLAVLSRDSDLLAFWADTSRGTLVSPVQDLAVAQVEPVAGQRRWAVAIVGGGLLFAAAALVAITRREN